MVTHPSAPVPQTSRPSPRTPLRILRTETVLSRFPIHNLTTHAASRSISSAPTPRATSTTSGMFPPARTMARLAPSPTNSTPW
jgi:hypothetical protein